MDFLPSEKYKQLCDFNPGGNFFRVAKFLLHPDILFVDGHYFVVHQKPACSGG